MYAYAAEFVCAGVLYGGQPVYGSPVFDPLLPVTAVQLQVLPVGAALAFTFVAWQRLLRSGR